MVFAALNAGTPHAVVSQASGIDSAISRTSSNVNGRRRELFLLGISIATSGGREPAYAPAQAEWHNRGGPRPLPQEMFHGYADIDCHICSRAIGRKRGGGR